MIALWFGSLWLRFKGWLIAAGAIVAALGVAFLKGRRSGLDSARNHASEAERATRRKADAAANSAGRDGADERLRNGRF